MKNIAVVGTGFLGRVIVDQAGGICNNVISTYNQNKFFDSSIKFDFFSDDISEILGEKNIDIVIISAKIEFMENKEILESSMRRFVKGCTGKRLVYLSSDGIFDGDKGMYTESDTPTPRTIYGNNLALCEKLVKEKAEDYCIIRPSYIYGYSLGMLDERLKECLKILARGNRLERFYDMYKGPMDVNQVAEIVLKLSLSDYNGLVHVAGHRKSVYAFTKEAMEAMGIATEKLVGTSMPKDQPKKFLCDTSMAYDLMTKLTGIEPLGVLESILKYKP